MLPHSIAADARLTAVDIRVLVALMYYAKSKHACTPCDRSIGDRAGGISAGTVQRSLRRLEALGYIRREAVAPSDANRTGRVLHLLWRCSSTASTMRGQTGGAATGERTAGHRRATPRSPARDKEDVVVEAENSKIETDSTLRSRPDQFTPAPTITTPATQATTPAPIGAPPFDLRAIGQPVGSPQHSCCTQAQPPVPPGHRRPRFGLTLEELASVAGDDPILAAELARRTAPPAPAEPPPATLPTIGLFELLPGRHDLITEATHRIAADLGDFKSVSWKFFQDAVHAVVTRTARPEVLLDCYRQAVGPTVRNRGSVFVTAWQREGPRRR